MPELEAAYEGKGYGDLKKDLAEVVVAALGPVRAAGAGADRTTRPSSTASSPTAPSAPASARPPTLARVYDRVGFLPRRRG